MRKFYLTSFIFLLAFTISAQAQRSATGTIIIHLDDAKYGNLPIDEVYVVFDKYDLTCAGFIKEKFTVTNKQVTITDVPEGKYYVDIFTAGIYRQHFSEVMKVAKKTTSYTIKVDDVAFFPGAADMYKNSVASTNANNPGSEASVIVATR